MVCCPHCKNDPCLWYVHGGEVLRGIDYWLIMYQERNDRSTPSNNVIRRHCYQLFTNLQHGVLGRGNRREIPSCVVDAIRDRYSDSSYMGCRSE